MRILSVDDSSIIRKIVRAATDVMQYELIEAQDGYEAFEKLQEANGDVDLILLDWNMPVLDGYEVLKMLKSGGQYRHIPVMMVTTESLNENIVTAIKAGASNYLIKPFTIQDLMKKILECVGEGDRY